jgi:Flp pilus assembly protein TadD
MDLTGVTPCIARLDDGIRYSFPFEIDILSGDRHSTEYFLDAKYPQIYRGIGRRKSSTAGIHTARSAAAVCGSSRESCRHLGTQGPTGCAEGGATPSFNCTSSLERASFQPGAGPEKKDFKFALESFREAVELNPDYPEARNNLGKLLVHRAELDGAVDEFRKALALRPDFAEAHENLGLALLKKRDLDGAEAEFRSAAALNFSAAQINLGIVLGVKGQLDDALAAHRRAVEFLPEDAEAHYLLGGVAAKGRFG